MWNLHHLGKVGRQGNERSASVKDDTGVLEIGSFVTKGDGIKVNLPVRLTAERDLDQLPSVVALVNSAKGGDRLIALLVRISKVEGKHGLIEEALVHHLVERRLNPVDRDSIKAQAKDTVEAAKGKGQARLIGCLGKQLLLDGQVADLEGVFRDKTTQATRAVSDGELGAILLIGGRRGRVVLVVQVAGDGTALGRWNPQVGASSVKHNLELLGGSAEFDFREIYGFIVSKAA